MSSHWSLNHRPTGSRVELAKHSHSTSWVWSWAGKLRNHLKDGHSGTWGFLCGLEIESSTSAPFIELEQRKGGTAREGTFGTDLQPPFWFPDAVGHWQMKLAGLLWWTPGINREIWGPRSRKCFYAGTFYSFLLSSRLPRVFLRHSQRDGLTWERTNLQMEQRVGWWVSRCPAGTGKCGARCHITGSPREISPLVAEKRPRMSDFMWQWPIRSSNNFSRSRQDHPRCLSLCSV